LVRAERSARHAPRVPPADRYPAVPDLLHNRLQSSLGSAYTLEQELGGRGMARVFVAEDATLGRSVVV
jgi:hypothetical protein